jgi:hypothetical protein
MPHRCLPIVCMCGASAYTKHARWQRAIWRRSGSSTAALRPFVRVHFCTTAIAASRQSWMQRISGGRGSEAADNAAMRQSDGGRARGFERVGGYRWARHAPPAAFSRAAAGAKRATQMIKRGKSGGERVWGGSERGGGRAFELRWTRMHPHGGPTGPRRGRRRLCPLLKTRHFDQFWQRRRRRRRSLRLWPILNVCPCRQIGSAGSKRLRASIEGSAARTIDSSPSLPF